MTFELNFPTLIWLALVIGLYGKTRFEAGRMKEVSRDYALETLSSLICIFHLLVMAFANATNLNP